MADDMSCVDPGVVHDAGDIVDHAGNRANAGGVGLAASGARVIVKNDGVPSTERRKLRRPERAAAAHAGRHYDRCAASVLLVIDLGAADPARVRNEFSVDLIKDPGRKRCRLPAKIKSPRRHWLTREAALPMHYLLKKRAGPVIFGI